MMTHALHIIALLVCILWISSSRAQSFDPYSAGPNSIVRLNINASAYEDLPVHLDVWSPAENGSYPVLYFVDGFDGLIPGEAYGIVMERIASHGVVVVLPWKIIGPLDPVDKLPTFQALLDWTASSLQPLLVQNGAEPGLVVDADTAIGGGHSSGAHLLCDYLRMMGCGPFKGLVLLSPVDGLDPWGVIDSFCIAGGDDTVNFITPTLFLPAGLDDIPGALGNVSCAPPAISNLYFYNALDPATPRWLNNATQFGHGDFLNPIFEEVIQLTHFCATTELGLLAISRYRNFVAGQHVSFIKGLMSEDCATYLPYLEDPSLMPVDVAVESVPPPDGACPGAFCTWHLKH